MGRAGLILGACGIPLFWVPMVYPNAPILGIIFSAIGYSRARAGKATNGKTAIIGLVLGILSLVLPAIVLIGMAFLVMHPDAQ